MFQELFCFIPTKQTTIFSRKRPKIWKKKESSLSCSTSVIFARRRIYKTEATCRHCAVIATANPRSKWRQHRNSGGARKKSDAGYSSKYPLCLPSCSRSHQGSRHQKPNVGRSLCILFSPKNECYPARAEGIINGTNGHSKITDVTVQFLMECSRPGK